MKIKHKNKAGFTLIELLVTMTLFSLIVVVLTDVLSTTLGVKLESEASSGVSSDANYIQARFMYDIPRSSTVTAPSLGSTATTLQVTIDGISNSYSLSSGNLIIT